MSLRLKITLLVVGTVALASFAFGRFVYAGLGQLLTQSSGVGAELAAQSIADSIDGNWLRTFNPKTDIQSTSYQQLSSRLAAPVNKGTIAVLGVVRSEHAQGNVTFVMSLPHDDSPDYYPPGTVEPMSRSPVYRETSAGYQPMELGRPGFFMVAWAPVNVEGTHVGLVIVATDMTQIKSTLDKISLAIAAMMLAVVCLSGLLGWKFATSFEKTAVTDGLMGIYNHKYFKQRLEQEVAKSNRYGQQTSLVFCDLDHFKRVNDTYGHATGDITLKAFAKVVTDTSRNTDVVARYGGEEIGIILTHTGIAGAQEFAERLRMRVAQQVIRDPEEDAEFKITVSIGVAQAEKGVTMLDLIKRADAALYHSKRTGRNRVTIYQEDILPRPEEPAKVAK